MQTNCCACMRDPRPLFNSSCMHIYVCLSIRDANIQTIIDFVRKYVEPERMCALTCTCQYIGRSEFYCACMGMWTGRESWQQYHMYSCCGIDPHRRFDLVHLTKYAIYSKHMAIQRSLLRLSPGRCPGWVDSRGACTQTKCHTSTPFSPPFLRWSIKSISCAILKQSIQDPTYANAQTSSFIQLFWIRMLFRKALCPASIETHKPVQSIPVVAGKGYQRLWW